jgi:Ca2+-binding EF-hand superfamily protein
MGKAVGLALAAGFAVWGAAGAMAVVGDEQGAASGKPAPPREAQGLKRYDGDRDRAITVDEFLKRRVDAFSKRDKNGDGTLDAQELGEAPLGFRQQRQERRMERLLVELDANSDGKVSKIEFETERSQSERPGSGQQVSRGRGSRSGRTAERRQLLFSFYDRNGDGVIEKAEYEAGRGEEIEFAKRRRLHALDRDGDGKVTLEEYTADARFRFVRLDLDRDGRITAADLPPIERQRWSSR